MFSHRQNIQADKAPDDYCLAASQEIAVNIVHPAGIEVLPSSSWQRTPLIQFHFCNETWTHSNSNSQPKQIAAKHGTCSPSTNAKLQQSNSAFRVQPVRQVEDLDHRINDVWLISAAQMKNDIYIYIYLIDCFITQKMWPLMSSQTYQKRHLHKALTALPGAISLGIATAIMWAQSKPKSNLTHHGKLQLAAVQVTLEAAEASA